MPCWHRPVLMSCDHRFCTSCWESYLTVKIQDGDAHHILCPAYQCHILVPVEVIEKLVTPDMALLYLQFDIKVKLVSPDMARRYLQFDIKVKFRVETL